MTRPWNEPGGQLAYNSFEVLEKFVGLLRNDLNLIAEKERSLGFLNESLGDVLQDLSVNQYPKIREMITQFNVALAQVEYARKVMYFRTRRLTDESLASVPEQTRAVKSILRGREIAYTRRLRAQGKKATEVDPRPVIAYKSINQQAVQSVGTYLRQLLGEVGQTITSFAHGQMELYAGMLQVWEKVIVDIDESTVDDEGAEVAGTLEAILETIHPEADEF
jgi:hypothetical protein